MIDEELRVQENRYRYSTLCENVSFKPYRNQGVASKLERCSQPGRE